MSLNNNTFAQYSISLTGGYSMPMPDLKGTYPSDTNSSYLQKSGFNLGADGKWYLGKTRNFGVTFSLGYNMFSSGNINAAGSDTTRFKTKSSKINFFKAAVGVEYAFKPKGKVNPFIGVEFTANFFSGKSKSTKGTVETTGTLKSASRFGLSFGAGVDIMLSKQIGIVIGGKYNMANLIGKKYDTTVAITGEYRLNDGKHTAGAITYASKKLNYLQFYAGITFYLGKPFKRK